MTPAILAEVRASPLPPLQERSTCFDTAHHPGGSPPQARRRGLAGETWSPPRSSCDRLVLELVVGHLDHVDRGRAGGHHRVAVLVRIHARVDDCRPPGLE